MRDHDAPDLETERRELRIPRAAMLSSADRKWIASHVSRAAERAFPATERIGKTPQQDFYFRELLETLIDNTFQASAPITGGTYAEIWQLTKTRTPKWRAQPAAVRGRSGYARQSIKILAHEWGAAFSKRSRAVPSISEAVIEFFLDPPGPESDDLVLRAAVTDLTLPNGVAFNFHNIELSSATRLPGARESGSAGDEEEKARLLREARKYVRRVEVEYLARLASGPIEFLEEEVSDLRRHRNNHRRIAAAVLGVITAGMIGYHVLRTQNITPIVDISPDKKGALSNVLVDTAGRIALASDGEPVSEWANVIVDDEGRSMRVGGQTTAGPEVHIQTDDLIFRHEVPQRWRENAEVALDPEGSCSRLLSPDRGVLCVLLVDIRRDFPSATADTATFAFHWGDSQNVSAATVHRTIPINSRVVVSASHGYANDGTYDVLLFISTNPNNLSRTAPFDSSDAAVLPLARFTWKDGVWKSDALRSVPAWLLPMTAQDNTSGTLPGTKAAPPK